MLIVNISKFKNVSFTECINHTIDHDVDSHIKRIVNSVIDTGKRKHGFNKKSEDDKIEYFLKYSLLEIVPSKKWVEYTDDKEDAGNDLYIVLKRHYFLNTNSFPQ